MLNKPISPNIQDFSTIESILEKNKGDLNLKTHTSAFYFYVLDLLFNLSEDEIRETITDSYFLMESGETSGHDRGIDAIYIEPTETKNKIHLFNFKHVETFEKTKSNFPANEIEKIMGFINALMTQDQQYAQETNPLLASKMNSIWDIFNKENPDFVIHICSNQYFPFEEREKIRFEREVHKNNNFGIEYHLMEELVNLLTKKGKIKVDAKIQAIDKQFFERSDGDVKALIVNVDVADLLRICIDNEILRNNPNLEDNSALKGCQILEDSFEDNVRIYLRQRSKINKNIKNTALSGEGHRLFYYNNGITITCDHVEYPGGNRRSPIINLSGLQIVNGSQTIHALFEAFQEDPTKFENMTILCRIYETRNKKLSINIAEYTNSQNPVSTRDIRSIDYNQIKLEKEFETMNYYYERKKGQYSNKPKNRRLDSEKVGQVLMAFYHKMPSEAKDKKRLIFAEKYEDIFNDSITANKILLPFSLFNKIENRKNLLRNKIISFKEYEENGALLYSSYWILYVLHEIAIYKEITLIKENIEKINNFYLTAHKIIKDIWKEELKDEKETKRALAFESFFKKNQPMKHLDKIFNSDKIKEYFP